MSYNKTIKRFDIKNEKLNRSVSTIVSVDPLGMCSVYFGISYSMSISSDDLNTLIGALQGAAREQNILQLEKDIPGIDTSSLREADLEHQRRKDEDEQLRRDEKNGLYPGRWDDSN